MNRCHKACRVLIACWLLWSWDVAAVSVASGAIGDQKREVDFNRDGVVEIHGSEPIITKFRVIYPTNGDVETLPLSFRVEIEVSSASEFHSQYGDKFLCVELDAKWKECSPLADPVAVFDDLPEGKYRAQAFITDREDTYRYHETPELTLTVASDEAFEEYSAAMLKQTDHSQDLPKFNGLVQWARCSRSGEVILVIGVNTSVLEGFERQQAIRETRASEAAFPSDVKVYFVGCVPRFDDSLSDEEREQGQSAIRYEKQVYQDLLTDELLCEDWDGDQANKVKAFLGFVTQTFTRTPFLMIADDTVYLRSDRLADDLRKENRTQRLYLGQLADIRTPLDLRNISSKLYPLNSYPPFASSSHYVLSMELARFIAKNSARLQGVDGNDDVSVALWLLTIQVHVEHTKALVDVRDEDCDNGFLSLAGVSPLGIRKIHANVIQRRPFCYGLNQYLFLNGTKADQRSQIGASLLEIESFVHNLNTSEYLHVTSVISTRDNAGIKVSYYPSAETFASYSRRACAEIRRFLLDTEIKAWMCPAIAQKLRARVQKQFEIAKSLQIINSAFLELWQHNLFVANGHDPFIIGYTPESSYASIVFECIFKTILEHHGRPILVVSERTLHMSYGNKPDVFIFSIFDADCDPMSNPGCPEMIAHYMDQYLLTVDSSSKLMMISGEAIDTQALDNRVPLLSSVSSVTRTQHVYLPVVSISFAERLQHTPLDLLSPAPPEPSNRRFCAYLYARCERPHRERMFDLLNALEPVDALGVCAGSSRPPDKAYKASCYFKWFNDEAVASYQRYKFVVAFENSAEPGYVTEKLANPLLAGSIPIYLGNSTTVAVFFNPDSYIDCGRFEKLEECAEFVDRVHKSPELYAKMRNAPSIRNITAFNEAFSWHPSVPSRDLANKVANMLQVT